MRWAEWKFSAQRAAQDPFIRWTTVITVVLFLAMSAFLFWRLLPEGWRSGVITLHYNIYLGIDEVRPWPWIFILPGGALLIILLDLLFVFGMYRRDALASRTLLAIGCVTTVLWCIGSFFLALVNT